MMPAPVESEVKRYSYHNPQSGYIETIDHQSGKVLLIQKSLSDIWDRRESLALPIEITPDHIIYVEKGIDVEKLKLGDYPKWIYTDILCDVVCQKITEGKSLLEIAGVDGVPPYYVLARWRREYTSFQEKINQAYRDRGEYYHGQAIKKSEEATEENVQVTKLLVDVYKWASGVDNPDRYGNKTKISGDPDAPLVLMIDTGIRRHGDPGFTTAPINIPPIQITQGDSDES